MNSVVLSGNIARDAELKSFTSRSTGEIFSIAKFSVAVNRPYPKHEEVDFYNCQLSGNRATALHKHLTKGKPVMIAGRLETYKTDNGSFTYIVCHEIEFQRGQAPKANGRPDDIPADYFG